MWVKCGSDSRVFMCHVFWALAKNSPLLPLILLITPVQQYVDNSCLVGNCESLTYYYVESPLVFQIRLTDSQVKLCWANSLQLKVVLLLENFSLNADNLHPGLIFKASKDTYILEYPPDNKLPNKRFKNYKQYRR